MQGKGSTRLDLRKICVAVGFAFLFSMAAQGQEVRSAALSSAAATSEPTDVRALLELIRDLQSEVQALHSTVDDLRAEQARASSEAQELRRELDLVKGQGSPAASQAVNSYSAPPVQQPAAASMTASVPAAAPPQTTEARIGKLEEDEQVLEGKVNDQYLTKIESGSKYRLRLSGIVLLNLFENRGTLNNSDFPEFAESQAENEPFASPATFGGTVRQSQIRIQGFGPDIAGARTSADVNLDFAGGLPSTPNGAWFGVTRLRTATVRFDWTNTSIVGGQDRLFFAPLTPTTLASLAIPEFSFTGNLWGWTPQVRVEHRFVLSDVSSFSLQGGILDSITGDAPSDPFDRYPSWGEQSGQPAYAVRMAWSHRIFGEDMTVGVAGYYGRQDWGFGRGVDGWAGMADLMAPLGKRFEFTGAFYRGRAMAGFGGGVGESVVLNGPFGDPTTAFRGLDSLGGWAQLKFKLKSNFEINGALGMDNPYAGELRQFNANSIYSDVYTRNLSPMANFIYQIRSDILISTEYRFIDSTLLDAGSVKAHQVSLSLGYIF
jgi:hypothetical protein